MLLCDNIMHMSKCIRKTDLLKTMLGTPMFDAQAYQLEEFAGRLQHATRFILDDAVVESACHVVLSRPSSIVEALRVLRVPLPLMWVEWADDARRNMRQALNIGYDNGRPLPVRFGFLITSDTDGKLGTIEYAWKHRPETLQNHEGYQLAGLRVTPEDGVNIANRMNVFDFSRLSEARDVPIDYFGTGIMKRWGNQPKELEALRCLDNSGAEEWTSTGTCLLNATALVMPDVANQIAEGSIGDIEGELLQAISTLILLTARNGTVSREVEAPAKLNKARATKGKAPLLAHRVVTMRLSPGERKDSHGGGAGRLGVHRRAHLVMGHYVTRGKTVYWRRAHPRGGRGGASTGPKTVRVIA